MGRGMAGALCLDLFLGQRIQHPLHGGIVGSHLAALQIGLGQFQLPQRLLGDLLQHIRVSCAKGSHCVRREIAVDLGDEALPVGLSERL